LAHTLACSCVASVWFGAQASLWLVQKACSRRAAGKCFIIAHVAAVRVALVVWMSGLHVHWCELSSPVYMIQPVVKPVIQPGLTTGWTNSGCSFNTVIQHSWTNSQTGLTTGWMFVYPIKPVVQPVWQPVVSCKQGCQRAGETLWPVCDRSTTWYAVQHDQRVL